MNSQYSQRHLQKHWRRSRGHCAFVLLIACLALLLDSTLIAQRGSAARRMADEEIVAGGKWIQTAGPINWPVRTLLSDGAFVFAGAKGSVFRSSDNGASWTEFRQGLREGEIISLATTGTALFAGTLGDGIARSTDGGATWTQTGDGLPGNVISVLAVFGGHIYAGLSFPFPSASSHVYRSRDNGATWEALMNGLPDAEARAMTASQAALFVSTEAGLYRSLDGTSWTKADRGLPTDAEVSELAVHKTNLFARVQGDGIWRSSDNGSNWTKVSGGLPNDAQITSLLSKEGSLFAALDSDQEAAVWRSTNDGANWAKAGNSPPTKVDTVIRLFAKGARLLAITFGEVFFSDNEGAAWTRARGDFIQNIGVRSFARIGTKLFAATSIGVSVSDDNGITWTAADKGLPFGLVLWLAASGTDLYAAGLFDGLWRSADGGATWMEASTGLPPGDFISTVAPLGAKLFASLVNHGVYVSENQGASWRQVITRTSLDLGCEAVVAGGGAIYAGNTLGTWASRDQGATWNKVVTLPESGELQSLAVGGTMLYAAGYDYEGSIYRSTDNGATWSKIRVVPPPTSGPGLAIGNADVAVAGADIFAAFDEIGVFVSSDNGATWTAVTDGFPPRDPLQPAFDWDVVSLAVSGGHLLAGTTANGVYLFSKSAGVLANVSAASYKPDAPLAGESIVAAFGTGLATATRLPEGLPLPTSLGGTLIRVKDSAGIERLAPLFAVTPTQVNYLMPEGTALGAATVTLLSSAGAVSTGAIQIAPRAAALFSANASGSGVAAATVLRISADGRQTYEPVFRFDSASNQFVPIPIDFGAPTDRLFLILFGTGIRHRPELRFARCQIGGVEAEVVYAGAQGSLVGVDQINVALPRSLAGRGLVEVRLAISVEEANVVQVNIR